MPSWERIYEALWQTGQKIALSMLRGSEHLQERQDIVATAIAQTVASHLKKKVGSRNEPPPLSDLEGMLKTVVRRRLLDYHRQRYRQNVIPLDDGIAIGLMDSALTPDGEAQAEDLWRTIATLDPPLPDLFTDRFLLGWSTTEIAARRGLNANTVLSHFHRGFARLREQFADLRP